MTKKHMHLSPKNRQNEIIHMLQSKEYAEIPYLATYFNVSEMTIRRDIDQLEKDNKVTKVYGGVRLKESKNKVSEGSLEFRKSSNRDAKMAIAKAAATLIDDNDVVAFDASTTALELSREIKFKKKITVITNNVNIAVELSDDTEITVILLGGFLRKSSLSVTGTMMSHYLDTIFIDKAFISCRSFNFQDGMTDNIVDEGESKQALISRSSKLYAIVDHSKINTRAFFKICSVDEIDTLITDNYSAFDEEQLTCLNDLRSKNVNIMLAD